MTDKHYPSHRFPLSDHYEKKHDNNLYLAIDQGGQSTRVALYSRSGAQRISVSSPCATQQYQPENSSSLFIEQNGEEILAGIKECLEKIIVALGDEINNVVAAGFAGQGSSLLAWDNQTGAALSPVLSWQDIRGEHSLADIPLSHAQVQAVTGLRISPHYGASKIRWCLDNNASVIAAQKNNRLSIGPIGSYIFWHLLSGNNGENNNQVSNFLSQATIDPGHAQRTLLWNLTRNDWDQTLLDIFHIPREILPQCEYHNHHFGNLVLNDHKVPVVASARDQGASLFARGLPDKNTCYINIGTGAFIQRVSEKLQAPEGLLVSPLWLPEPRHDIADSAFYAWEATVNGAASAIAYMEQQTGLAITPEHINTALALTPAHDCYFLNAIGGLSAPYWRTDVLSHFSEHLSAQEKILAWLESIIFQIVINVELMHDATPAQKIYISGGLSNADLLCQKIADLTRVPVYRSDNADATLQGIAYLAAGMPSEWHSHAGEIAFQPQSAQALQARFDLWQEKIKNWLA